MPQKSHDYLSIVRVAAILGAAALPALVDPGAIPEAASLHSLAESANPYWVPSHAVLLYIRVPLAIISACILVLAPGLILALASGAPRTIAIWLILGFMLSLPLVNVPAIAVQGLLGEPLRGRGFVLTLVACALLALFVVCLRIFRGHVIARPWSSPFAITTVGALIVPSFITIILLTPKFLWEALNGDGAHTLEAASLLLYQPLPFFSSDAGAVSGFPGITMMLYTYPLSSFVRLFGDIEASVRVPWVLFLCVLFCAVIAFAEQGRNPLARSSRWLVWAGLGVYSVTIAFSATYSPYSADIALPATQDTLFVALFLTYVFLFLDGRAWWMALAIVLVYLATPGGMMLMVLWSAAAWFLLRPSRRFVVVTVLTVLGCAIVATIAPAMLDIGGLPVPGREHRTSTFMGYFAYLRLDDWRRLLFMVVPGGILPALSLALWKRHDAAARCLTLVTTGYFLLFYVQASISLHYFVPAMLLPIAVFWRQEPAVTAIGRTRFIASVAGAALLAMVLSFPRNTSIYVTARAVGSAFQDRFRDAPSEPASFRRFELAYLLFPAYENRDTTRHFAISPLVVRYYSQRRANNSGVPAYAIVPRSAPPPSGRLAGGDSSASLFVLSDSVLKAHLALRPPEPAGSPIYVIPWRERFRTNELRNAPGTISTIRVLGSIGVDTAWLKRAGGKR